MPEPGPSSAATGPVEGPVEPWCTVDDLVDSAKVNLEHATWAIQLASYIMWAKSGRRYGLVDRVVRPWRTACAAGCAGVHGNTHPGYYPAGAFYYPAGAGWGRSYPWGAHPAETTPRHGPPPGVDVLTIPGPIAEVARVVVNGDDVDLDGVRIARNRRDLYRLDGRWPHRNDLTVDPDTATVDHDPPAWAVHYRQGRAVPLAGRELCAMLAAHLTRARAGDQNVPAGVTRIARRGVTMELQNPRDLLSGVGLTGLHEVDLWLDAVNPHHLDRPTRVVRPRQRRDWDWIDA